MEYLPSRNFMVMDDCWRVELETRWRVEYKIEYNILKAHFSQKFRSTATITYNENEYVVFIFHNILSSILSLINHHFQVSKEREIFYFSFFKFNHLSFQIFNSNWDHWTLEPINYTGKIIIIMIFLFILFHEF